ncbi:MAG: hypothetical protein L3J89_10630 [Gammaproteobacteria bacterium]|nr:hypothetical protein [Gammaproteobacteria bacterium]
MARSNVALKNTKRGMRALRSHKQSIDLTNIDDVQRLKRFLKIARVSAVGAIVIDATFAGQKVKDAAAAGENAEKVAYEEYGALIGGILFAGAITAFFGPGLIVLTVVGGVSALAGAKFTQKNAHWHHLYPVCYTATRYAGPHPPSCQPPYNRA